MLLLVLRIEAMTEATAREKEPDDGALGPYQDHIKIESDDHSTPKLRMHGEDGQWFQFVTAHYRRKA